MIPVEQVVEIHEILIDRFGGLHGVRDRGLLGTAEIFVDWIKNA